MQYGEGLISKVIAWIEHPGNSNETITDWLLFVALILMISFLWTTVLRHIPEAV
jgi:hypothetical protein